MDLSEMGFGSCVEGFIANGWLLAKDWRQIASEKLQVLDFSMDMVAVKSPEMGAPLIDAAVGYRCSWVLVLSAVITVAVVGCTIRGVQRLGIGLIWWGKHPQLQVMSAECFASHAGDGECGRIFSAEIKKKSNDQQSESREDGPLRHSVRFSFQNDVGKFADTAACNKMEYRNSIEEAYSSKDKLPLDTKRDDDELFHNGYTDVMFEESEQDWRIPVPDWASSLLHPLSDILPSSSIAFSDQSCRISDWDAILNMRLKMLRFGNIASTTRLSTPMQHRAGDHQHLVAQGSQHMAKARGKVVRIWDTSRKRFLEQVRVAEGKVSALDICWEEKKLLLGNSNGTLSFWDLPTGKCISSSNLQDNSVDAISFNIDGRCIMSGNHPLHQSVASLSLFDPRILTQACGFVSSMADLYGVQLHGHECFARNSMASLAEYDLRMIGALPLKSLIIQNE